MKIIGDITSVDKHEVVVDIGSPSIGWYSLRIPRRKLPDHPRTGQRLMLNIVHQGMTLAGFELDQPVRLLPPRPRKKKPKTDMPAQPKDYNNEKLFRNYVDELRKFFHEKPIRWMSNERH